MYVYHFTVFLLKSVSEELKELKQQRRNIRQNYNVNQQSFKTISNYLDEQETISKE